MSAVLDSPDWTMINLPPDPLAIAAWLSGTDYGGTIEYGMSAVNRGFIYVCGGLLANVETSAVKYAALNNDGTMGAWLSATSLPVTLREGSAAVFNNYLYVMGGSSAGVVQTTVYKALINLDGTLGAWSTTTALPVALADHRTLAVNGYIYLVGGYNAGAPQATVYAANIALNGNISAWVALTALPYTRAYHSLFTYANKLYVVGGIGSSASVGLIYSAQVYSATMNEDGTIGAWGAVAALPESVGNTTAVLVGGAIYVIGGGNAITTLSDVYAASLNPDGTISAWQVETSLPQLRGQAMGVSWNAAIYVIGGESNVSKYSSVLYAIV